MKKTKVVMVGLWNPITLLMVLAIITLSYLYVDQPLVNWLFNLNLHEYFPLLTWITQLGNYRVYLILFFFAALFFRYAYTNRLWEQRAWFLWLCVALSNLACSVLKVIFGRARPNLWLQSHEYGFSWLKMDRLHMSFPSSHTATIMSIAFGFAVIFPRLRLWFVVVGVLISLSRVLLLQHYLSDVLAAIYLSLLVVTSLVYVLRKKRWLSRV